MSLTEALFKQLNMGDNSNHRCVFCDKDPTVEWKCKCRKIFEQDPDRFYLCDCGDWCIRDAYEDCKCLYEV